MDHRNIIITILLLHLKLLESPQHFYRGPSRVHQLVDAAYDEGAIQCLHDCGNIGWSSHQHHSYSTIEGPQKLLLG